MSYRIVGPKKEWNYSIVRKTTVPFVLLFHAPYCTSACTIVYMIVVTYTTQVVQPSLWTNAYDHFALHILYIICSNLYEIDLKTRIFSMP